MRKTDYAVVVLIVLNYMCTAALLTHVDGFVLPAVAVYAIAVAMAPIAPLLAILPQLGVRVPTLITGTPTPPAEPIGELAPLEPAPLHPVP